MPGQPPLRSEPPPRRLAGSRPRRRGAGLSCSPPSPAWARPPRLAPRATGQHDTAERAHLGLPPGKHCGRILSLAGPGRSGREPRRRAGRGGKRVVPGREPAGWPRAEDSGWRRSATFGRPARPPGAGTPSGGTAPWVQPGRQKPARRRQVAAARGGRGGAAPALRASSPPAAGPGPKAWKSAGLCSRAPSLPRASPLLSPRRLSKEGFRESELKLNQSWKFVLLSSLL